MITPCPNCKVLVGHRSGNPFVFCPGCLGVWCHFASWFFGPKDRQQFADKKASELKEARVR